MLSLLFLAVEFFVDHFLVLLVGGPEEEDEIADNDDDHDDELHPVDRVVELVLDDVVRGGSIGKAELNPLLDLRRSLAKRFPCGIVDLLNGA